jgi:hypothetical protein
MPSQSPMRNVSCYKPKMLKHLLTIFLLTILINSCKENGKYVQSEPIIKSTTESSKRDDSLKITLKKNFEFFSDSLLNGNKLIIQAYLNEYLIDTCGIITYKSSILKSEFAGIKTISSITNSDTRDSVFVFPPFGYCDGGQSYCFFDEKLPRLKTDSYCCDPENLFVVQDIDEDGIKKIGIYYSTCASRYKSLRIYSLKSGQWKEIGESDFDVLTQDPTKVQFNKLVKKISKKKFKICSFIDGEKKWNIISME